MPGVAGGVCIYKHVGLSWPVYGYPWANVCGDVAFEEEEVGEDGSLLLAAGESSQKDTSTCACCYWLSVSYAQEGSGAFFLGTARVG